MHLCIIILIVTIAVCIIPSWRDTVYYSVVHVDELMQVSLHYGCIAPSWPKYAKYAEGGLYITPLLYLKVKYHSRYFICFINIFHASSTFYMLQPRFLCFNRGFNASNAAFMLQSQLLCFNHVLYASTTSIHALSLVLNSYILRPAS